MIWKAWNNGRHHKTGAGYGFKINSLDRDKYFSRDWKTVYIDLPQKSGLLTVEVNTDKNSFWGPKCSELINKKIGRWLIELGHSTWSLNLPPHFRVELKGDRHFSLKAEIKERK